MKRPPAPKPRLAGLYITGFLLGAPALALVVQSLLDDSGCEGASYFVQTSPVVNRHVGKVRKVHRLEVAKVEARGTTPAYTECTFRAVGRDGTATVVVEPIDHGSRQQRFLLIGIE